MRGMSDGGRIAARGTQPLALEEIAAAVPAVFATEAHESRSARFAYIPTAQVLEGLGREGFEPFYAQQAQSRIPGKSAFTKHLVRLRHRSRTNDRGEAHEVILVNAHDGTSAYQMVSGVFRFVCANGLFAGDSFGEVKVRHTGQAVEEVIEGAYTVLGEAEQVMGAVEAMQATALTQGEQAAFATAAFQLRFEDADKVPIQSERLLDAQRQDDRGPDLWRTFNRVQENLIRGGQQGLVRDANGRRRRQQVREVKAIDQSRSLNRALWTLAEEMAKLKHAA
ncbi:MAG: DUF932 domain-containing protein [Pseudomonadota bacterium]